MPRKLAYVTTAVLGVLVLGSATGCGKAYWINRAYNKAKAELKLSPDQSQKVDALKEKVVAQIRAKHGSTLEPLIADGKAIWLENQIDDAKIESLLQKIRARSAEKQKYVVGVVKELHGILTPDQRTKLLNLIEKYRAKMKKRWKKYF